MKQDTVKRISLPLTEAVIADLRAGDNVLLSGAIYVARDAAHRKMAAALDEGQPLPVDIRGQIIYYMGPSPARPGRPIGSAGPTTSRRLDGYSPRLMAEGLKGMIGKGRRSPAVREAMKQYGAVYLAAVGGSGALLSGAVLESKIVAYRELGAEAIRRLVVKDFPATVINDIYGGDLYETGPAEYRKIFR